MAAATIADGPDNVVFGNKRVVFAKITTPADGSTFDSGLAAIENVQITYVSGTIAAADAVGINSISGGIITFETVGTARDVFVQVVGY